MPRIAMRVYPVFIGVAAIASLLEPDRGERAWIQIAGGAAATLAFLLAIRINRPQRRLPWLLFAAAFGLWAVVGGSWYGHSILGISPGALSLGDAISAVGYPLLIAGAISLVRPTRAGALDVLLDATIVATGCGMFVWLALVVPADNDASVAQQLTSALYPTLDLALVATLAQLLVARQTRRLPSVYAFAGAAVLLLVSDCGHALNAVAGAPDGRWVELGWFATYGLAGLGVLHPSSAAISSARLRPLGPSAGRLGVLCLSTLAAPVGLVVGASRGHVQIVPVAVWGAVLLVVLFARMAHLFRDQQRSQIALSKAHRSLEAAQQVAQVGSWTSETGDFATVSMSSEARRILGIAPGESDVTVESFLAAVHPDDRARVAAEDAAATAVGNFYELEYRIVRPDGEVRLISDQGDFVLDAAGRAVRIDGAVQDITERRRSEEALRVAEARFRTLVEQLPLVTYIHEETLGGPPVYISPQIEDLLGYSVPTWLSNADSFWGIVHPDDRQRLRDEIGRFQREGGRFECEYRYMAGDGREVWVLDQMVTVQDDEGGPRYSQGFLVDVTKRKHAEQALAAAEARHRTLVERLPMVSYVSAVTEDTLLVYMSPQIAQLTGYTAEECVSDPELVRRVIHPDDVELVISEARRARRDLSPFELEFRMIARDGRIVWVLDQMIVVRDDEGLPVCFQGFLLDITGRKRLEEQLQQSQRMDVVGRLAGGVAHDFNNLLTVINGYTGFALERIGGSDEQVKSDLEQVQEAGERATSLTQQLLAFSRRQVLQPRPLELAAVVADVQQLLVRLIGADVELVTHADSDAPLVLADPGLLEQVLVNLVENAREAMPRGGTLTVETRDAEVDEDSPAAAVGAPPGRYATLAVRDTGSGMDDETRALAFEPFFTTKDVSTGGGLGLSTVYGIVKQSGGWITLDSAPGAGTEVTIFLAATEVAPVEEDPLVVADSGSGRETVLLVEDEAIVRALVLEMLERQGYRVVEAPGPHEAIALFEESGCDVLLTDVVMPGLTGLELARRLREQRPELQVVYMSGYTADRVFEGGGLQRGDSFLQKPFTEQALAAKVREALAALPAPVS